MSSRHHQIVHNTEGLSFIKRIMASIVLGRLFLVLKHIHSSRSIANIVTPVLRKGNWGNTAELSAL